MKLELDLQGIDPPETIAQAAAHLQEGHPEVKIPDVLSILPVRNLVLFPGAIAPVNFGRKSSLRLLMELPPKNAVVGLIA